MDAVVYFRIVEPEAAVVKVENYLQATTLIAQTTLRSVLGQCDLDELLGRRDKINQTLQEIIDRHTGPWGVKVTAVEVRDVVLPDTMKRAMARQAETERERRAKIIAAEGEFQAAEKLVQAAAMIANQPIALQLRYLQTIGEIAGDRNTTTIIPLPIELLTPFLKKT
jgi:regulator of protease activity HflC (stomatin/prohibitin superfamily)